MVVMEDLEAGDEVNLLLSCVLVDDEYRETDALKVLLNAHLTYYRSFSDRGILVGDVITSNVTKAGERFSERMGFERIGRSHHGTALYRTGFRQLYERVGQMKPRLEAMLLQFEKDLLDPIFCSDIRNLTGCLAADFIEYGQTGAVYDREMTIGSLSEAKRRNIEIEDFSIRCLSSHIAVAHYTAVKKDGEKEDRSLRTSIWVREEGSWKLHFHQGTEKREG